MQIIALIKLQNEANLKAIEIVHVLQCVQR